MPETDDEFIEDEMDEMLESFDCLEDILADMLQQGDLMDKQYDLGGES